MTTSSRRLDPRDHPSRRPPRGPDGHRRPANSAPPNRRRVPNRDVGSEPPDVVVEVRTVDGEEGERLARQQARVFWEVTEWLVRNKSEHGREQAG